MMETGKTTIRKKQQLVKSDPFVFYEGILGANFWEKQREIALAIEKHDRVVVRSCHASGKTFLMAHVILRFLYSWKNTVVITSAPSWKQVEMVLWRDIANVYAKAKVPLGGLKLKTRIDIGPKWYAAGFSTDEPTNFQGFHSGDKILVVLDESSGIPNEIFESIDGILAGGEAKLVLIGNPNDAKGRFIDAFKDPAFYKVHISAFDTPNVKEKKIIIPGLVTWEWVEEMRERYGEDSDPWRVRVLGEPPLGGDDVLIPMIDVEAAINRTVQQKGLIKICVDVARFGSDASAVVIRQGLKVLEAVKWYGLETTKTAAKVDAMIRKYESAQKVIAVDDGGVGGGVTDMLRAMGHDVVAIAFGSKPTKDEFKTKYRLLRDEMYWNLKQQIKELDLPKNEDWYQACDMKYEFRDGIQFIVESKKKMKGRGLSSPDLVDALAMTCYPFEQNFNNRFTAATHFSM